MKENILYYDILGFQAENIELLKNNFQFTSLSNPDKDTDNILKEIEIVFAPLGYFCGHEKIDRMPKLKIIASNTTGTPHIDTEYAKNKNIEVISLKGRTDFLDTITPTAEHAWGLLLSLTRRIPWAFESVCGGGWNRRLFGGRSMLSQMTLGIVGLGRLGKMVAGYGKAFRMPVSYYDPWVAESPVGGVRKVRSLEELVTSHEVISIHVPLEKETEGMFDREILARFKPGSYLVNTSRAKLIDSHALVEQLESGRIAGAALDVIDGEFERNIHNNLKYKLLTGYAREHDNLLITPHIGGSTIDAWRLTEEYTIRLILSRMGRDYEHNER